MWITTLWAYLGLQGSSIRAWSTVVHQAVIVMASVFIRGFDFDTDDESIRRHCATAGKIVSIERKGKGGALVTYKSEIVAARAVDKLDQSVIPGNTRYIDVKQKPGQGASSAAKTAAQAKPKALVWNTSAGQITTGRIQANPKGKVTPAVAAKKTVFQPSAQKRMVGPESKGDGKSCFVRGMDHGTSQEEILDYLSSAGEIVSSKFGKKNTNVLVTYADKEAAAAAIATLNGTTVPGNERYIDVMLHKPQNVGTGTSAKKQKTQGPSGPDLERERLTAGPITGVVASFKGSMGWIQPDVPFEHETAQKHKGKIYVHKKDVATGTLSKDDSVQFEVYVDASGLGAEDVVTL